MTPVAAAEPSPVVSYIDDAVAGTRVLSSAAPDGAGAVVLMPAANRALTYDVSEDGDTLLVGLATGASYPSVDDRSYGLVLVSRTPSGTTSTLLTNTWDTHASLSADGSTAWWMAGGKVWKHTAAGSTLVSAVLFAPGAGEEVTGFSVSPDGTRGAALYWSKGDVPLDTSTRVFAAGFAQGRTGPYLESTLTPTEPNGAPVWVDDRTVLVGMWQADVLMNERGTLEPGGNHSLSTWMDAGSVYDLERLGTQWWAWRDMPGATQFATAASLDDLAAATWTPRSNGATTFHYRPSAVTPPAFLRPANRAAAKPTFFLSSTSTTTGHKLVYVSYAEYLTALPGQTFAKDAFWTARGRLEWSIDALTWKSLGPTSWAHPVRWPGGKDFGNAYTPVLRRTTWLRWHVEGDDILLPSAYVKVKVTVSPVVTATVTRTSSGLRRVAGRATRVGGTAVLQRASGSRWVTLTAVRIGATGAYAFAPRSMPRGTYRVVTKADASWGAGAKVFRI